MIRDLATDPAKRELFTKLADGRSTNDRLAAPNRNVRRGSALPKPSAQLKGAALTYARRYALFTLVGIAGEDDLDAPELIQVAEQPGPEQPLPAKANAGRVPSPRRPVLSSDESAGLRDRLVQEIAAIATDEALALWAYRSLPLKNTLTPVDAQAIEAAYLAKLSCDPGSQLQSTDDHPAADPGTIHGDHEPPQPALPAPPTRAVRRRSKAHLAFVATQPCLVCQASPCDAHPPQACPTPIVGEESQR
jgi:hypothetical protein